MREIKFRGKALEDFDTHIEGIEKGDWVYGYYYFDRANECGIIVTELQEESGGVGSGIVQVHIKVDYKTVGQYTGLKDKNKVEIFEGDILKVHLKEVDYTEYDEYSTDDRDRFFAEKDLFGEVKIRICGGVGMIIRKVDCKDEDIEKHPLLNKFMRIRKDDEIIGNVYSNPELLNKT